MSLAERLRVIQNRIDAYAQKHGRDSKSIRLLAVSKTRSAEDICEAIAAGQRDFGENYVQEAIDKIISVGARFKPDTCHWHFIGPIQSNKTKKIAAHFDWVHSVDRLKIAEQLNRHRAALHKAPLNVCIAVNINQEASKSGVAPEDAEALAAAIAQMPHLTLRGLMTIPKIAHDFTEQRHYFNHLRLLFEQLQQKGYPVDTLSMGMSDDFEAAIAEGSTWVRIGTAIFGPR